MKKETILLIVLILTTIVRAQVPTYRLDCVLPAPHCTSVDLSPDGTKLCARMQYGSWNEGYRVFDADTSDICNHTILNDCGGYAAPWIGRVSTDSKYLYTTLYYNGCVAKIELSTCAELLRTPVGSWPYGLAFDSQRRYLYVGVNVPGTGTTGSLSVIDTLIDQVICNLPLGGEPGRCIVVGPKDEFVYLVTQNLGNEILYKFAAAPGCGVSGTLTLPGVGRGGISVNPDGKTVYVPDVDGNLVHIIDTVTMTVSGSWSIPSAVGFFVSPDGTHALVVGSSPDIRVFDLLTETVIQTIPIPDIGTSFDPGKSIPYWDENNGMVYINLSATEGGVTVLVPERVGPVACWSFDDAGDPGHDDSGNGHDGTVYGAEPIDGFCGNALSFDGVDDHVDMGLSSALRITGPITVGSWFWAETAALSEHPKIVSRCSRDVYHGYSWETRLYWGRPEGWISENGYHHILAFGSEDVSSNEWHHLAMTYQPDDFIKLYLDGELVGQVLGDIVPDYINDPDGVPIYVGAFYWEGVTPGSPFTGNIDEVRIYDRALSPCEIKELATPCEPVGPAEIAAIRIREAIAEKVEALEKIDAALEKEWAAYEALEELFESGDYGDLKKGGIVATKQKIHSAIQHQEQSKKALEKSIEKLEDSLALLGGTNFE